MMRSPFSPRSAKTSRTKRAKRSSFKPTLETLEDRTVPASLAMQAGSSVAVGAGFQNGGFGDINVYNYDYFALPSYPGEFADGPRPYHDLEATSSNGTVTTQASFSATFGPVGRFAAMTSFSKLTGQYNISAASGGEAFSVFGTTPYAMRLVINPDGPTEHIGDPITLTFSLNETEFTTTRDLLSTAGSETGVELTALNPDGTYNTRVIEEPHPGIQYPYSASFVYKGYIGELFGLGAGTRSEANLYQNDACSSSAQFSLDYSIVVNSSVVSPTELKWNTTTGGVDYAYKVTGADLGKDVPVALYWSSSDQFAGQLGTIKDTESVIHSGTAAQDTAYTTHVDGKLLKNAPAGTTHLLVVIGDPNDPNFDATKDVQALKDVQIAGLGLVPNGYAPISPLTIETIKGLLREAGQGDQVAQITSTVRTPHQQAVAMYRNLEIGRLHHDNTGRNYAAAGQAVIAVYDALRAQGVTNQATIVNAMEAEINLQQFHGGYDVSHHCASAAQWALLQVIDIAPSSIRNPTLFHAAGIAAKADGRLSTFLDQSKDDPAFHLEIPQM
jgi:hypothetical protein